MHAKPADLKTFDALAASRITQNLTDKRLEVPYNQSRSRFELEKDMSLAELYDLWDITS